MLKIKKDYMWEINIATIFMIILTLVIGAISIILLNSENPILSRTWIVYKALVRNVILIIGMYPVFAFAAASGFAKMNNSAIITAHLPFSKKQLFFKALKPWLILYPIFILASFLILKILQSGTTFYIIGNNLNVIPLIATVLILIALEIQIISGMIITISKKINGFILLFVGVLINIALAFVSFLALDMLKVDLALNMNWIIYPAGIFFIVSIIIFIISWKDVEAISK
ncbi:hypothetical protein [Clostridium sp.]|uniref:hypothetical protein n=1 Tax=Clostridium sp. TaxID=1506 RepID=UPI003F2ACBCC